jgi:Asp-tRNA(Asn)/Glu-tRNA(Gln) amidotransferase A subunit family amidase
VTFLLDHCGPIVRTVEDAALVLNVLPATKSSIPKAPSMPGRTAVRAPMISE